MVGLPLVAMGVPAGCVPLVQADRGIGCSPDLVRAVQGLGWHFLFRVQKSTRFRTPQGKEHRLADLIMPGQCWSGSGFVFKKAGWRTASMVVYWGQRYRAPLCLVSDLPPQWTLIAVYRRRFAIEPTFRDWKSYGWR